MCLISVIKDSDQLKITLILLKMQNKFINATNLRCEASGKR